MRIPAHETHAPEIARTLPAGLRRPDGNITALNNELNKMRYFGPEAWRSGKDPIVWIQIQPGGRSRHVLAAR